MTFQIKNRCFTDSVGSGRNLRIAIRPNQSTKISSLNPFQVNFTLGFISE